MIENKLYITIDVKLLREFIKDKKIISHSTAVLIQGHHQDLHHYIIYQDKQD
jgi:hypothetical protein